MKQKLVQTAMDMRNHAHAPYSNYRVGAAVETESGEIIGGCNVETSSYGLTCCAERTALFRAIAEGHTSFKPQRTNFDPLRLVPWVPAEPASK